MSNITLLPAERYTATIKAELEYTHDVEYIHIPAIKLQIESNGRLSKVQFPITGAKQILVRKDLIEKIIRINREILILSNEQKKMVNQLFFEQHPEKDLTLPAERYVSPTNHWRGYGDDRLMIYVPQYKVEMEANGSVYEKEKRSRTVVGEGAYNRVAYGTNKIPRSDRHKEAEIAALRAEESEKAVKQICVREDLVKKVAEIRKQLIPLQSDLEKMGNQLFTEKHNLVESKDSSI